MKGILRGAANGARSAGTWFIHRRLMMPLPLLAFLALCAVGLFAFQYYRLLLIQRYLAEALDREDVIEQRLGDLENPQPGECEGFPEDEPDPDYLDI